METIIQCKLCSVTNNLISLFSGKCVENRSYIRKLVEITTGIKFTENGVFNHICFNCTIQIYNFHIFKTRAAENESRLQSINSSSKLQSLKYKIPRIDDIKIPNLEELKSTLGIWLLNKRQTLLDSLAQEKSQHEDKSDQSIQSGEEIQCDITKKIAISTQTDILSKCDVNIQCNLQNKSKREIYTQTESQLANVRTQTHNILKSSVRIQCNLENKLKKRSYTQTEFKTTNIETQTEADTNCIKGLVDLKVQKNHPADLTKTETNCPMKSQITNNLNSNRLSYIQNIYINQNTNDEGTTISLNNKKEISSRGRSRQYGNKDTSDMKCPTISTKEIFSLEHPPLSISHIKEELRTPTPPSISPILASSELTPGTDENDDAKNSSSDDLHVPPSCNLLAIKERVQHVQICKHCDFTMYSKSELKNHKKIHLRCSFCKKTFSNVNKTRIHMDFECQQKVASLPAVHMVRIDDMKEIKETLPEVHTQLTEMVNDRNVAKRKAGLDNTRPKKLKLK